nr:O-antigen ligase family protein [Saprospiraceae bacterium]
MKPAAAFPAMFSAKEKLLFSYWFLVVFSIAGAILLKSFLPLLIPAFLIFVVFSVQRLDLVFLLLFMLIPLSTELMVTDSLGTDFPGEQLMWYLFGVYLLLLVHSPRVRTSTVFNHPISWIIFLHLGWIFFTLVFSENHLVSFKFFLSKLWYVGVFYFLAYWMIGDKKTLDRVIKVVFASLLFTAVVVFIRHGIEGGFTFATINSVVNPFYRNKVNYSAIIAVLLPLFWYLRTTLKKGSGFKFFLTLAMAFLLVALYFGYTRASMIALIAALFTPLLLRHRLIKPILVVAVLGAGGLTYYMFSGEKYLEYAPDYERTITHHKFDNLLEATYQFEDISTMERFYRWIAGYYMVVEKPVTGFGPNTFYESYKPFTVRSYETYVSDNPEKSGIHNYYLMLMIEQGIIGFTIFFALVTVFLLRVEKLYQRMEEGPGKNLLVAIAASTIVILLLQLMNDLIEVDKIGPFFWLWLALLVKMERDWSKSITQKQQEEGNYNPSGA